MAMITNSLLRAGSVAAVMLVGSCAAPLATAPTTFADGDVNNPITVEPVYQSIKVAYSGDLSPDDAGHFTTFVQDYLVRGNGAITVSVPEGPGSTATITYFGEQLAALGVPRARIMVGTHDAVGADERVEIGFISYTAHADSCGDWSQDVAATATNLPPNNFGCAVQHNLAAMVADPRDLVAPSAMGESDPKRRAQVLTQYEQGQPTGQQKSKDQSGAVSDVNQ
ncbi:MAG: CpaD family pilus assembly lipoprotein [Rhizomicrobium sp.]|jgi:pilus assembly protein CpaD